MSAPRLAALATAVPEHRLDQDIVVAMARDIFASSGRAFERMLPVYENAGIRTRYSVAPPDWYGAPHGWRERNALFVDGAVNLLERAALDCLQEAAINVSEIDAIVAISTTGIATPSLDALIMERLGTRRDVARLPIFGLGCAGGVLGLSRAASLAESMPGATVLVLVVELCALTFRHGDRSKSNVVATALFGDGAAAALLTPDGTGPRLGARGEHTWSNSLDVMGWRIEDDGLGVLFSSDIPNLVRTRFGDAMAGFLDRNGLCRDDMAEFVCHPGGAKVVDALEDVFELPCGGLDSARGVLRDYGNMSAATVFFVLERALRDGLDGRALMTALGPGFTAAFQVLEP